ncbi:DUF3644 domain-containing protein [Polaromonas glacialis]|uniref:DUF3644 domain-containing protein n=1 Tax=Polaromonas glacialis TaxID=866564 RepID=UPI000A067BBD
MKARSKVICNHSISMAISAMEIYNKPNFANREQIFTILMVAAWESLLKAKIIKNANNKLSAIYVKNSSGRYKKNRNNAYLTISIDEACNKFDFSKNLISNIQALIRVRDAAIHLTADSVALPYLAYILGAASLKNYSRLISEWFGVNLNEYNFFILPLGFSYPFKSLTLAQVKCEPETIALIINDLERERQSAANDDGYFLVCEIQTSLISAKRISEETGFTTKVDPTNKEAIIINQKVNLIDQYLYSWTDVLDKLKKEINHINHNHLNQFIKDQDIKNNKKYSAYNFRNKEDERRGPSKATSVLYNDEFIAFALQSLKSVC